MNHEDVLLRYAPCNLSWRIKLFLKLRFHLIPFRHFSSLIAKQGLMLDLGCGYGLWALTLALESPQRQIIALDHDGPRIEVAKRAADSLPNLNFYQCSLIDFPEGTYASIAMIDVLHYFEEDVQRKLIERAYASLSTGGILLIREINASRNWRFYVNSLYEKLATRIGFTKTEKPSLYFHSTEDWTRLLETQGFEVVRKTCLLSNIFYICRRVS